MISQNFQVALGEYFGRYKNNPRYEFWISDHLQKVGIPNNSLLKYIESIVEYIGKKYLSTSTEPKSVKILDLGCGMGEFATYLSLLGYKVVGVDMDEKQLKLANILKNENRANVEFIITDAMQLPFRNDEFDLIICFDVFEHVKDIESICREMNRVLKLDGAVFLRFPNKLKWFEDHVGLPFLPLLPKKIFQIVFKKITKSRKYYQPGLNVYYRTFSEIYKILRDCGFYIEVIPEKFIENQFPYVYRNIIKNIIKFNESLLPIIQPYFHLILTKKEVCHSIQYRSATKIKLIEFIWGLLVLICGIIIETNKNLRGKLCRW